MRMTQLSVFHGVMPMYKKSDMKRDFILEKAKKVFRKKGFAAVTIKDIVDECGISRGGIYLYFHSVDEIFMQVIFKHNEQKLREAKDYIIEGKDFKQIIDIYFERHKKRLLNISNSLLIAMYEYRFAHKEDYDKDFFYNQFLHIKDIIWEILNYGVQTGDIADHKINDLAMLIIFFIEGFSMLGTAAGISEEYIDSQIGYIKEVIFSNKGNQ
jgi:AcrR family transcriptional regulator